jgi:protein-S-isoprenylcysteine O-methyltransferase Ste14
MGQGTKTWDKVWNAAFWPLMLSIPLVAGVDVVRLQCSRMPPGFFAAGGVIYGLGMAMSAWAMGANPFFEGTVRIQSDRGHRVVDVGPYRHVRHPGYVGLILWALGTPFLLLSWWALVPAVITVAWVALRAFLEDRTLRRELAGYEDYARSVQYRLVPGLW